MNNKTGNDANGKIKNKFIINTFDINSQITVNKSK